MTYMYGFMTLQKGAYGMIEDAITYPKSLTNFQKGYMGQLRVFMTLQTGYMGQEEGVYGLCLGVYDTSEGVYGTIKGCL